MLFRSDVDIIAKSDTAIKAIEYYLIQVIENSLLRVLYTIESQSALLSYFPKRSEYKDDIRKIWFDYFNKIEVNSDLEVPQRMEVLVVKYDFNLEFPFITEEYKLCRRCYELIKKNTFEKSLNNFCEEINKNIVFDKASLNIINQNEFIMEIYLNDFISLFLLENDIELEQKYVIEYLLEKIYKKCTLTDRKSVV